MLLSLDGSIAMSPSLLGGPLLELAGSNPAGCCLVLSSTRSPMRRSTSIATSTTTRNSSQVSMPAGGADGGRRTRRVGGPQRQVVPISYLLEPSRREDTKSAIVADETVGEAEATQLDIAETMVEIWPDWGAR